MTTDQASEFATASAALPRDMLSELGAIVRTLYGAAAPTPVEVSERVPATVTVVQQPAPVQVPTLVTESIPVPVVAAPISITEAPSLQQERNSHSLLQELAFLDD